jgi:hypothetical protein
MPKLSIFLSTKVVEKAEKNHYYYNGCLRIREYLVIVAFNSYNVC